MLFLITNYVACMPVVLSVGVMSLYHLWSLLNNTTSIEGWEKENANKLRRKGRINQFTFPFSLGILRNLQAVLGKNPFFWGLPQRMNGDGLSFPTQSGLDPLEQYVWPPQDLFTRRTQTGCRPPVNRPTQPFTYGESLNSNLIATKSIVRTYDGTESTGSRRRLVPPYHRDYLDQEVEMDYDRRFRSTDSDEQSDSACMANLDNSAPSRSDEDDDEPLAKVLARRKSLANPTHASGSSTSAFLSHRFTPRVRRGSEGYEVDPPSWHLLNAQSFEDPYADVEGMYEEGSEGSD